MDPIHAKLHKASREVKMDPHLRDGFRRTLSVMAEGAPAAAPSVFTFRMPRALAFASAAVVVALSGASVTLASSRAVPGDALYAAKVSVLEPVERALAITPEAKGEVAVLHLERRFREAAELAAAGRYDEHDEQLAQLAERDRAVVEGEGQELARARFDAVAAAYAPSLRFRSGRAFATAVRLDRYDEDAALSDEVAEKAAREQLARVERARQGVAERYAARMKNADRLAAAAEGELDRKSFRSALQLSGEAAKIAGEVEILSSLAATSSTSTAATSSPATEEAPGEDEEPAAPTRYIRDLIPGL